MKAYSNLGATQQELGKLEEAETNYSKAIALKPDYIESYSNLGVTLNKMGRLKEAEASYTKAIELNPNYDKALYNRSQLFFDKAKYELALRDADACASKEAKVLSLIALYKLGRIGEIYKRLRYALSKVTPEDISIAAFAAFISKKRKKNHSIQFLS